MLKFQPPMSNDEVCRMATDKQTHKYTHKHTYRVKTEETFFAFKFFYFLFSFKKVVSNNKPINKGTNLKMTENNQGTSLSNNFIRCNMIICGDLHCTSQKSLSDHL